MGSRIIVVGDHHQCHPAGVKIALTGKGYANIENVQVGQQVITYNSKKSFFPGWSTQGRKILEKQVRPFTGSMVNIVTKNSVLPVTPNHKCLVRFNSTDRYCLYIMVKGESGRIGICRNNYKSSFGLSMRSRQENADKSWLLAVYATEYEARVMENVYSAKFGLPQLIFKNNMQKSPCQRFVDDVYAKVGNNIEKVKICLQYFCRMWEFPLWTKEEQERFGEIKQNYVTAKKSFVTQACNLIDGEFSVRTYEGTNRSGQWEIAKIYHSEEKDLPVYSLSVEPTEDGRRLYIANNIVTCNSIYGFRGADCQAFQRIEEMLASNTRPLSKQALPINYRCDEVIIEHAQELVPALQGFSKAKGIVDYLYLNEALERANNDGTDLELPDGIDFAPRSLPINKDKPVSFAFLCRVNLPLITTAYQLISMGKKVKIIGKNDIGGPLKQLVEDLCGSHPKEKNYTNRITDLKNNMGEVIEEGFLTRLDNYYQIQSEKLQSENFTFQLEELQQTVECLQIISQKVADSTVQGIYEEIDALFNDSDHPTVITLSTIHRSKGLEWDVVFILKPELLPHPNAKPNPDGSWSNEQQQEKNCQYIGRTRPKHRLYYIMKGNGQSNHDGKLHNDNYISKQFDINAEQEVIKMEMDLAENENSYLYKPTSLTKKFIDDGEPF